MRVVYPVIFTQTDTNILIEVPDLQILTEAKEEGKEKGTLADAIEMARDVIGLKCIDEGKQVIPSDLKDINVNEGTFADAGSSCVSYVDVELTEYRRRLATDKLNEETIEAMEDMSMQEHARMIIGLRAAGWSDKEINDFMLYVETSDEQYKPKAKIE